MRTDSDVIVTQYRAEFRAEPFTRPSWHLGGMEYRQTLPHRRAWTVARDIARGASDVTHLFIRRYKGLALPGSTDVHAFIVPDNAAGSRYGVAVVVEQRQR